MWTTKHHKGIGLLLNSSPDSVRRKANYDGNVKTPLVDATDQCNCRIFLS